MPIKIVVSDFYIFTLKLVTAHNQKLFVIIRELLLFVAYLFLDQVHGEYFLSTLCVPTVPIREHAHVLLEKGLDGLKILFYNEFADVWLRPEKWESATDLRI